MKHWFWYNKTAHEAVAEKKSLLNMEYNATACLKLDSTCPFIKPSQHQTDMSHQEQSKQPYPEQWLACLEPLWYKWAIGGLLRICQLLSVSFLEGISTLIKFPRKRSFSTQVPSAVFERERGGGGGPIQQGPRGGDILLNKGTPRARVSVGDSVCLDLHDWQLGLINDLENTLLGCMV